MALDDLSTQKFWVSWLLCQDWCLIWTFMIGRIRQERPLEWQFQNVLRPIDFSRNEPKPSSNKNANVEHKWLNHFLFIIKLWIILFLGSFNINKLELTQLDSRRRTVSYGVIVFYSITGSGYKIILLKWHSKWNFEVSRLFELEQKGSWIHASEAVDTDKAKPGPRKWLISDRTARESM